MSDDEIWRRWRAQNPNEQQAAPLTPADYREINELELEVEFEHEWGGPPPKPEPKPVLRYASAELSQLQTEGEEALKKGRAVSAADLFEQALLLFEASPNPDAGLKGQLLNGLGRAQYQQGTRQEAEATFGQALGLARSEKNAQVEQEACFGLGLVYLKEKRVGPAADNLRQALTLSRQQKDQKSEAKILVELGAAYAGQSMFHRAVPCLLMAQRLYAQTNLITDYTERKEAERAISDQLHEIRKRAEQVNSRLGHIQYEKWVADSEAGTLPAE